MDLDVLRPIAFALLILVPWVLWVSRRSFADLTPRRAKVLRVLRVALVVLVTVALVHIVIKSDRHDLPVSAVFCVDTSGSISDDTLRRATGFVAQAIDAKREKDLAGIVTFGGAASLASPVAAGTTSQAVERAGETDDTDLAAAIRLAAMSLPEGTEKRIVLLTDGNATRGDAAVAAAEAARRGIRIDTVPLASGRGADVAVSAVQVPDIVRQAQPFDVNVRIDASGTEKASVKVKLFVGDMTKPAQERTVEATPDGAWVTFPVELKTRGFKGLRVTVEADDDAVSRNNTAEVLVNAGAKPNVLIIAPGKDDAVYLAEALNFHQVDFSISAPKDLATRYAPAAGVNADSREYSEALAGAIRHDFDVVIIANVPATAFTRAQMAAINRYVYDFGGGLVMVGGRDAFGSGKYYKTPIDLALPVYTDPMKDAPVFAVVLIMDKSWSMGDPQIGEITKIDMVKETVIAALGHLVKTDWLAVVSFDTEVHDIIPMTRVENVPAMVKEISTMGSFGLTNFYPALIKAERILKDTVADYKHAVLLSDGRPSGAPKDYEGQLEKMQKERIVVSAIAVGVDADKKLMNQIAAWGKGQYYFTEKAAAVPEVILKEVGRIKEPLLVEGDFQPRPGPWPRSPMLKDIDVATMPKVLGFNRSRARETAQVELVVSGKDEPLLASWRYGLGTVVAFTADAKNVWCPAWVSSGWQQQFARFWRQVVLGSLQQQRGREQYRLTLDRSAGSTVLIVDAADRGGLYLSAPALSATVTAPGAGGPETVAEGLVLSPAGPGRFTGEVKVSRDKPLYVALAGADGSEVYAEGTVALAPAEYLNLDADGRLLEWIRAATGGKTISAEEVFEPGVSTAATITTFDVLLLALAAVLFAVDVLVRRLPALLQVFRRRQSA